MTSISYQKQSVEKYCVSPNCENKCGRKLSEEVKKRIDQIVKRGDWVTYGYFCGEPEE